ncbi:MAG: glycosyltransferase N-terminal domain-containing protein [Bacteroidota bacterium]
MSIIAYRLFLWIYKGGAILLSPFNEKAKRWLSGRKTVFRDLETFIGQNKSPVIWFHCASLGEFEQARPLLEGIREQYAGYSTLLSFFSPSGYEIRKDYSGADCVIYLPMDSGRNARRFLDLVKPVLVVWVKYEYWHFYLKGIRQRKIPLLLVSGIFRPEQPFFSWWGGFYKNMLGCFTHLFVQTRESKNLLGSIGFSDNVTISGDTRFDRVIEIAGLAEGLPLVEKFIGGQPVIIAGSTWEADEEELDHFANTQTGIKFIIAPHEIDEVHLQDIEKLFRHTVRYSVLETTGDLQKNEGIAIAGMEHSNANVLLVDNIGMLARLYQYATIAYVGGGFGDDGVHNVLEAAVYGKPVIFGPIYEKFVEAVELVDAGGAFSIENALELEDTLLLLLKKGEEYNSSCRAAGNYVSSRNGATRKILSYIQENRLLTN